MEKIALFFSGQGSQFVGMGKTFYDNYLICRQTYEEASDIAGIDISKLCFEDSIVKLSKFQNMQLAVATTNIAIARSYFYEYGMQPQFYIGHSIGEICALVCSGAVSLQDGIRIILQRGILINDFMKSKPGYMAIVEGMDGEMIQAIIQEHKYQEDVFIACESSSDQVLISGRGDNFDELQSILLDNDARITPLISSPPMHSPLLEPIADEFFKFLQGVRFYAFQSPIISNYTGRPFSNPDEIPLILSKHLTNRIRWKETVSCCGKYGISMAIEMGPKNIVTNFISKLEPDIVTYCYGQKLDRKKLHEYFLEDSSYQKDIPDFLGSCLGIAVSCENHNDNSNEYNDGVVVPYNRLKKMYSHMQETKGKLNVVDMQNAVKELKTIFGTKKLTAQEQEMWLKKLYDETSTYYILRE